MGYQASLSDTAESPTALKLGFATYAHNGMWTLDYTAIDDNLKIAPYPWYEAGGDDTYLLGGNAISGDTDGGNVYIYGGAKFGDATNGNVVLAFDGEDQKGYVGVGTDTPLTLLDVTNAAGDLTTTDGIVHFQSGSPETPVDSTGYPEAFNVRMYAAGSAVLSNFALSSEGLEADYFGIVNATNIVTSADDSADSGYIGYQASLNNINESPSLFKAAYTTYAPHGDWTFDFATIDNNLSIGPYAWHTAGGNHTHLVGGNAISGNLDGGNVYIYGGAGNGEGDYGNVFLAQTNMGSRGRVAIGRDYPLAKLDVDGGIRAAQLTANPCASETYPEGTIFYNDTDDYYCFCGDGSESFQLHDPEVSCFPEEK
jgi:hypothetical protein